MTPNLADVRRLVLILALLLIPLVGLAQEESEPGIDVIDVSGPLDASALEFMRTSIEAAAENGQVLAVLQMDSPAVLDEVAWQALIETMAKPPLPVAVWIGPGPAVAYGGVARLALDARTCGHRPRVELRHPESDGGRWNRG